MAKRPYQPPKAPPPPKTFKGAPKPYQLPKAPPPPSASKGTPKAPAKGGMAGGKKC